eukprot:CAMPEP_0113587578 /NCGR_PEP_ID=MMETSP0015_2-20120614/34990_1 /TAXON_ID=2838 /ORGANISM="Odontella" /LENGTH=259 /DNA_ID=CAMNT_0000493261 /DNA_START=75 /DNA_END=851 /DNA_ORIENTATION=+ /assembly_acc=CAM_ASM_000160
MIRSEEEEEELLFADHGLEEEDGGELGHVGSSSEADDTHDYYSDSLTGDFDGDESSGSYPDEDYSTDTSSSQSDEIIMSSPETGEQDPSSPDDEGRRPLFFWDVPSQWSVKRHCCYNARIGKEGIVGLARFLVRNSVTESLLIGGKIGIGNSGAATLARAVALNSSLSSFGMCGVDVEEEGMRYLREACELLEEGEGAPLADDRRVASFLRPLFDGSCPLQLTLMDAMDCGKRAAGVKRDPPSVLHMTLFSSVTNQRIW